MTPTDPRQLGPLDPATGLLNVYVECARGSNVKHKFDERSGALRFHKDLPEGMAWPFGYGFVCGTRGPDGDPFDAAIPGCDAAPGALLAALPLGVIEAEQTVGGETLRNDRVVAWAGPHAPPRARLTIEEVARFFVEYNEAQGRRFRVIAIRGPEHVAAALRPTGR